MYTDITFILVIFERLNLQKSQKLLAILNNFIIMPSTRVDCSQFINTGRRAPAFLRLLWCGRRYACLCMCVSAPQAMKTIHMK